MEKASAQFSAIIQQQVIGDEVTACFERALKTVIPGQAGAVVSFSGGMRAQNSIGETLDTLFIECYRGMAEAELTRILERARQRWRLLAAQIIHRIGEIAPGERIVFVAAAAKHRRAAFEACEFMMDFLKTQAPFWKKERLAGIERWVTARDTDLLASKRWRQ